MDVSSFGPRPTSGLAGLVALALLGGCGGAAPARATTTDERVTSAPTPTTATELVRLLETLASEPAAIDAYIDHAFAERLPSEDELAGLFRSPPDGCVPSLTEGPGYGAIAIPPPMDDDDEQETRRIEAIIAELSASTEVIASCTVTEDIDGEPVEREVWIYAIAVRRGDDGAFRALAWRDLRSESGGF